MIEHGRNILIALRRIAKPETRDPVCASRPVRDGKGNWRCTVLYRGNPGDAKKTGRETRYYKDRPKEILIRGKKVPWCSGQ